MKLINILDKKIKYVAVIRHGERADAVDNYNFKFNISDPELTEKGMKQSYSIGQQLSQIFRENFKLKMVPNIEHASLQR